MVHNALTHIQWNYLGPRDFSKAVKLQIGPQWVRERFIENMCMLKKNSYFHVDPPSLPYYG